MELGYRGLGLWICANATGEEEAHPLSVEEAENYWKERAIWCRKAGVDYWKVDWGYHCGDAAYREMMTRIVKQYAPDLKIEHAVCRGPLDEKVEHWKRVGKLLSISDYVRTYDVVKEFTYSTTIARTWEMFDQDREVQFGCRGIPNIEDAPLLAAGLCCSMGVMRHPCWGGTETDVLDFGRKWNEVERALRWQRIAPPFGIWESSAEAFGGLRKDWTEMLPVRRRRLAEKSDSGGTFDFAGSAGYSDEKYGLSRDFCKRRRTSVSCLQYPSSDRYCEHRIYAANMRRPKDIYTES